MSKNHSNSSELHQTQEKIVAKLQGPSHTAPFRLNFFLIPVAVLTDMLKESPSVCLKYLRQVEHVWLCCTCIFYSMKLCQLHKPQKNNLFEPYISRILNQRNWCTILCLHHDQTCLNFHFMQELGYDFECEFLSSFHSTY